MKHYKTNKCLTCPLFERCTTNKKGRLIERSEHMDLIEANRKRHNENLALYRKRQAIVEHPFGVIKRQWDFYYIMTKKTIKHASADVGLIFTAYNLRRILNIVDPELLKNYLKKVAALFLVIYSRSRSNLNRYKPVNFFRLKISNLMSGKKARLKTQLNPCFVNPFEIHLGF